MLVTAGPGSGKTHVIITRLNMMIHVYQIPPEKIMVITFTKDAARSMRTRFLENDQQETEVSFGTFHSFYYQIIRTIPKYSKYRLVHEKERKYILSQVISMPNQDEKEDLIDRLIKAISFYKNTEEISKAATMADLDEADFKKYMLQYDSEKETRKVMDFDDMLFLCLKLLYEDNELLKKWKDRFTYYLVDEFQDCNPVQYKILKILADRNLFVVGDDDQAIYGFRGADSHIMQRFIMDYPDAERIILGINYRCGSDIVRASSCVIYDNKIRMPKELIANKPPINHEYVHIRKWPDRKSMLEYFKGIFKEIAREDLDKHTLLFRTNQEMQIFAVELLKNSIPFQMKDKNQSIYEHFLVKDIMAFLQAAGGNRDRSIFLRILNKPRGHIGREALEDKIVDFEKIKKLYQNAFMYNPAAIKDIESLELHLKHLKRLPLSLAIRYIRKAIGYEKYLHKRAGGNIPLVEEWMELLDWLQEDVLAFQSLQQWEEYQKEYEVKMQKKTDKDETNALSDIKNFGVHIMTMHASKGLEFDHCYILNVNDGMIPKYQKGQKLSREQLEEERRIFYVGMTRAKKTLELHYLTGTKERPKFPSRFIEKLMK